MSVPLRVDFAGGWLDVPKLAVPGACIVNMAISPTVTLEDWVYHERAGLGGSAAYAILKGEDPVSAELGIGVGWQDPAVILETGLCVWASGPTPKLLYKDTGEWLSGLMAVKWSGRAHDTPSLVDKDRNYGLIAEAGMMAADAAQRKNPYLLGQAMLRTLRAQVEEGMEIPQSHPNAIGWKYCGGGYGGYVAYLFLSGAERDEAVEKNGMMAIEPYEC